MGSEENVNGGMIMCSDVIDPFYGSNWDPVNTMNLCQNAAFVEQDEFTNNPHDSDVLENQAMARSSLLVHFQPDSDPVGMVPKISSFGVGCFAGMVDSFDNNACFQSKFAQDNGVRIHWTSRNDANLLEQNSGNGILGASLNGKRKKKVTSGSSFKNTDQQQQDDPSEKTCELPMEVDSTNKKTDQNLSKNLFRKNEVDQANDNAFGTEPSKENYIHMRAKRGQATNSHSLAERVRRERISERMKLLQELVPGCNKITGKAVMLDEIINYVQSLQKQVEFLSMKLATVNPEINIDIDQILSNNILHSVGTNASTLVATTGLSSSQNFPGFSYGNFRGIPDSNPPFHPLQHNSWNTDLQSFLPMEFDSTPSTRNGL